MKINTTVGSIHIKLDTSRIDNAISEAQMLLNERVVDDCDPLIPHSSGFLKGSVKYPEGMHGGKIEYDAPYAHYQYEGTVYGPNIPVKDAAGNITGWWSPPHKYPTKRKLEYHTPGTGAKWFEEAKKKHESEWIKLVKDTVKKG